jgi:two-component system chemotaxis response regulator CheB
MQIEDKVGTRRVRALVTDDSALYRRMIGDILRSIDQVEVIGAAFDGEDCLGLIEKERPDLVTLDLQMPRRDGLSTLREIKARGLDTNVVVVCSPTSESAEQTVAALQCGALDLILKPASASLQENARSLESQIRSHVETVIARVSNRFARPAMQARNGGSIVSHAVPSHVAAPDTIRPRTPLSGKQAECVCIGVSTGGPKALQEILRGFPENFRLPIFIVQHMPPLFTKSLADHLNQTCAIKVHEASDGDIARAGNVYIAPGGKHMKIDRTAGSLRISVTDDLPVAACKPSVDYLFQSIHAAVGGKVIVAILTGMGNDGLASCRRLAAAGAHIIAQNAESCVVYGMPRQIVENHLANEILPLQDIGGRIVQIASSVGQAWR